MTVCIPPYSYIHAVTLTAIERVFRSIGVVSALCIGVTKLLDKLACCRIDVGIITFLHGHKVRIACTSELSPGLNTVRIQCNPLLGDDLFQLNVVGSSTVPCHVTGGNVGIIVRSRV